MRPIDADALLQRAIPLGWSTPKWVSDIVIDDAPTVDAVPVVRCKECKYYRTGDKLSPQKFCFRLRGRDGEAIGYNFADDDFCSYGERSEK